MMTREASLRPLVTYICVIGVFALFAGGAVTIAAEKNYQQMRREFEEYTSSEYYMDAISPREAPESRGDEARTLLQDKIRELLEIKTRWEELVKRYPEEGEFFRPNPEVVEEIKGIATSDGIGERLAGSIDLDLVLATAVFRNRGLKMAKSTLEAALERYSQVTNLDDIMRQYSSFIEGLATKVGPQSHMQSIGMRFPFPSLLALKGDIVDRDVKIARERYETELRELITNVCQVYYEIVYTEKAIEITGRSLDVLERLEGIATTLYATGKTSYTDVIKLQVRIARLKDDLTKLLDKKEALIISLNSQLDLPSELRPSALKEPEVRELAYSQEQLIEIGLVSRQEIRVLELTIEKMALMIEMAEREIYPDFTLGYSYFQNVEQMQVGTQGDEQSFDTRPAIPTRSWFGRMDAYIREMRVERAGVEEDLQETINTFRSELKDTLFEYANARRLRNLYRNQILDQVRESLDLAIVGYQTGALTFPDVATAEVDWLESKLEYQRSIADQNKSFSALERIVGRPLAGPFNESSLPDPSGVAVSGNDAQPNVAGDPDFGGAVSTRWIKP